MNHVGTWADLIDEVESDYFVGREQELINFRREVSLAKNGRSKKLIFFISGQGGVGKSTLLNHYQEIAEQMDVVVVQSDEQQGDVPTILGRFAEQLADAGYELKRFNERYTTYRQHRKEIEADPEAPQGLTAAFGQSFVHGSYILADGVPVLRGALDIFDRDTLAEQVGELTSEWGSYLAKKLNNKDDVALLKEPEAILSSLFFGELNEFAHKQIFQLCFDNFEFTRSYLDDWLLRLGKYQPSQNIRLAIAGRTPPGPSWERLRKVLRHMPLAIFTPEEAQEFLDLHNVYDAQRRQEILDFSGRLPVLMSWLADPDGDEPDPTVPTADLVERFLRWISQPELRQVALYTAIPRYFNLDTLALLFPANATSIEVQFEWLCERPFVRQRQQGWQYHDVVQRHMLHYQRQRSESTYRRLHTCLADYYATKCDNLTLPAKECWKNERWRHFKLEYAYHHLMTAPDAHWRDFLELFTIALREKRTFARELADLLLLPASHDELNQSQCKDAALFVNQLEAMEEGSIEDGMKMFERLCNISRLSTEAEAYALAYRGEAYRLEESYEEALPDFDRAIELDGGDVWAIVRRGRTYQSLERYSEALTDFNCAMNLAPNSALALISRGATYQQLEDYDKALADLTRAIDLNPYQGWLIAIRGLTYGLQERYNEELADLSRAIELDPNQAWMIAKRGQTYQQLERHDEALADLSRAIELGPNEASYIASRALTYQQLERYDEAIADFTRAINLNPNQALLIFMRGLAYQQLEHYHEAIADFSRAIKLDPNQALYIANRGETYQLSEHYHEALADFTRSIELDPHRAWLIASRGQTYQEMERYDEAIADFTRAIEIDPDDHSAIIERGKTYASVRRYEEALADLDCALTLDESLSNDLSNQRGLILSYLGRYAEAIESYKQGLQENPSNYISRYNIAVATVRWKGLAAVQTEVEAARELLLDVLEDQRGSALYGLGGLAALEGDVEDALSHLEEAIRLQKGALNWARNDIAWLELRDAPRFQALLSG